MVKKLLHSSVKSSSNILFSKQKTILSGAFVIGIMLLASAILGLIKQRLYASIITPGPELDAFFAAFRIPDLMFSLLIGGSLNAAFIPLFSQFIEKRSKKSTWEFASTVLNLTMLFFTALSIVFFLFAEQLALIVGSGFDDETAENLVQLMKILLISPILLGLSSFISGVLQSFQRFLIPFFSPVVYNLGAIFGVVALYPISGIEGAAWGVVIGSAAHLLIQLPALRHVGFSYQFNFKIKDKSIKQLLTLSLPRTIGVGVEQLKVILLISFASFLPTGSISFFNLGQSITNIPASILGLSIAQASLPQFAHLYANKDFTTLRKTFQSSFHQILFFTVPVVVVLVVLKIPVVRLVYGTGNFTWQDTVTTSWVVAFFALGIFAHAINNLMVRFFYALQETKLPVILGIIGTVISLILALLVITNNMPNIPLGPNILLPTSGIGGLALAVSVGAFVESILLLIFLHQKEIIVFREFIATPIKIFISGLIMAVLIYIPVQILDEVFIDTTLVINLLILVWLVVSTGFTTYLLCIWFFGVKELEVIFKVLLKIKDIQKSLGRLVKSTQEVPHVVMKDSSE